MKRLILLAATVNATALASALLLGVGFGGVPAGAQEPTSSPPPTPVEQLRQAEQLRLQLKWDEAGAILRQVVGRQAEDRASAATAQVRIGKYLLDRSRPAEAEPELNQVLSVFADQPEAVFWARMHLIDAARSQGRQSEASAIAERLISDAALPAVQHAWAKVKYAEIQLDQGLRGPAAEELRQVVSSTAPDCDEPRNWARVRLAETATFNWAPSDAIAICDAIVADHGTGKANDEQAAWGLIWKARSYKQSVQYTQAAEALQMAIALADTKFPAVAFDAWFELGEVQRVDEQHEPALATYGIALERAMSHKLPEDKADLARLQVGSEMRHLGMRERGIAWLRMGIEDPANLRGSDQLLAERMVSFMTEPEAEAWQHYLLAPAQNPDPTQSMVQAEFNKPVPAPSSAVINQPFLRVCWLGRLYEKQGRYDDAEVWFRQAMTFAVSSRDRAEALTDTAKLHNTQANLSLGAGEWARVRDLKAQALLNMTEATQYWLELALTGSSGESHYATEQIVDGWMSIEKRAESLAAIERLVGDLTRAGAPLTKVAFARLMRARGLGRFHERLAEAARAALELADELGERKEPDLTTVRVLALLDIAVYEAMWGAPFEGLAQVNRVELEYPRGFGGWIEATRSLINRKYLAAASAGLP